jgi:hypothetical protein
MVAVGLNHRNSQEPNDNYPEKAAIAAFFFFVKEARIRLHGDTEVTEAKRKYFASFAGSQSVIYP